MEKNIKNTKHKFLLFLLITICLIMTFSLTSISAVEAYDNGSQYADWRYEYHTTRNLNINYNGGSGTAQYFSRVDRTSNIDPNNVYKGKWLNDRGIGTLVADKTYSYHFIRGYDGCQQPQSGSFKQETDCIGVTSYLAFKNGDFKRTGYKFKDVTAQLSNGEDYYINGFSYENENINGVSYYVFDVGTYSTGFSPSWSRDYTATQNWLNSSNPGVNFTVNWTPITYTVVFNGNGATGGSTANQTFSYGTGQYLNSNGFSRTGYTFAGWATSSTGSVVYNNGSWIDGQRSTTDGGTVNLYAVWTPVNYTVSFNSQGGTWSDNTTNNKSYTVTYGGSNSNLKSLPYTVSKTGYDFCGFYYGNYIV